MEKNIIQPSESFKQELAALKDKQKTDNPPAVIAPQPTASSFNYPSETVNNQYNTLTPHQSAATLEMSARTQEANRAVSMRVKSVLVIGIILAISSIFVVLSSVGQPAGTLILIIGVIQLFLTYTILFSRDEGRVQLILKIFLVFQLISLFRSFSNPVSAVISLAGVLLVGYAYTQVKSLSRY